MVVLIFTIMISFAALNTNFLYTDVKQTENFAKNLAVELKLARQLAVMQQATLRLMINPSEYGFQKLKRTNKGFVWEWMPQHSVLKKVKIKKGMFANIQSNIEFYPNGRFKPFMLVVTDPKKKARMQVFGDENGEIGVTQLETK